MLNDKRHHESAFNTQKTLFFLVFLVSGDFTYLSKKFMTRIHRSKEHAACGVTSRRSFTFSRKMENGKFNIERVHEKNEDVKFFVVFWHHKHHCRSAPGWKDNIRVSARPPGGLMFFRNCPSIHWYWLYYSTTEEK